MADAGDSEVMSEHQSSAASAECDQTTAVQSCLLDRKCAELVEILDGEYEANEVKSELSGAVAALESLVKNGKGDSQRADRVRTSIELLQTANLLMNEIESLQTQNGSEVAQKRAELADILNGEYEANEVKSELAEAVAALKRLEKNGKGDSQRAVRIRTSIELLQTADSLIAEIESLKSLQTQNGSELAQKRAELAEALGDDCEASDVTSELAKAMAKLEKLDSVGKGDSTRAGGIRATIVTLRTASVLLNEICKLEQSIQMVTADVESGTKQHPEQPQTPTQSPNLFSDLNEGDELGRTKSGASATMISERHQAAIRKISEQMPHCLERSMYLLRHHLEFLKQGFQGSTEAELMTPVICSPDVAALCKDLEAQGEEEEAAIDHETLHGLRAILTSNNTLSEIKVLKALDFVESVFSHIQAIDVCETVQLVRAAADAGRTLKDQNTVLMIGGTGAGKTTSIYQLAGVRMEDTRVENIPHIGPVEPLQTVNGTTLNEATKTALSRIQSTPFETSETRDVVAVPVSFANVGLGDGSEHFVLCDTPGFDDTRGVPTDIANGVALVKAVKSAKSVIPVLIVSWSDLEGRLLKTLPPLAKTLDSFVTNLRDSLKHFHFMFTKMTARDTESILPKLERAVKQSSQQNYPPAVVMLLTAMLNAVKVSGPEALVAHPVEQPAKVHVSRFLASPGITDPSTAFSEFIGDSAMQALRRQLYLHANSVTKSLQRRDFNLFRYKLEELGELASVCGTTPGLVYEQCCKKVLSFGRTETHDVFERLDAILHAGNFSSDKLREALVKVSDVVLTARAIAACFSGNDVETLEKDCLEQLVLKHRMLAACSEDSSTTHMYEELTKMHCMALGWRSVDGATEESAGELDAQFNKARADMEHKLSGSLENSEKGFFTQFDASTSREEVLGTLSCLLREQANASHAAQYMCSCCQKTLFDGLETVAVQSVTRLCDRWRTELEALRVSPQSIEAHDGVPCAILLASLKCVAGSASTWRLQLTESASSYLVELHDMCESHFVDRLKPDTLRARLQESAFESIDRSLHAIEAMIDAESVTIDVQSAVRGGAAAPAVNHSQKLQDVRDVTLSEIQAHFKCRVAEVQNICLEVKRGAACADIQVQPRRLENFLQELAHAHHYLLADFKDGAKRAVQMELLKDAVQSAVAMVDEAMEDFVQKLTALDSAHLDVEKWGDVISMSALLDFQVSVEQQSQTGAEVTGHPVSSSKTMIVHQEGKSEVQLLPVMLHTNHDTSKSMGPTARKMARVASESDDLCPDDISKSKERPTPRRSARKVAHGKNAKTSGSKELVPRKMALPECESEEGQIHFSGTSWSAKALQSMQIKDLVTICEELHISVAGDKRKKASFIQAIMEAQLAGGQETTTDHNTTELDSSDDNFMDAESHDGGIAHHVDSDDECEIFHDALGLGIDTPQGESDDKDEVSMAVGTCDNSSQSALPISGEGKPDLSNIDAFVAYLKQTFNVASLVLRRKVCTMVRLVCGKVRENAKVYRQPDCSGWRKNLDLLKHLQAIVHQHPDLNSSFESLYDAVCGAMTAFYHDVVQMSDEVQTMIASSFESCVANELLQDFVSGIRCRPWPTGMSVSPKTHIETLQCRQCKEMRLPQAFSKTQLRREGQRICRVCTKDSATEDGRSLAGPGSSTLHTKAKRLSTYFEHLVTIGQLYRGGPNRSSRVSEAEHKYFKEWPCEILERWFESTSGTTHLMTKFCFGDEASANCLDSRKHHSDLAKSLDCFDDLYDMPHSCKTPEFGILRAVMEKQISQLVEAFGMTLARALETLDPEIVEKMFHEVSHYGAEQTKEFQSQLLDALTRAMKSTKDDVLSLKVTLLSGLKIDALAKTFDRLYGMRKEYILCTEATAGFDATAHETLRLLEAHAVDLLKLAEKKLRKWEFGVAENAMANLGALMGLLDMDGVAAKAFKSLKDAADSAPQNLLGEYRSVCAIIWGPPDILSVLTRDRWSQQVHEICKAADIDADEIILTTGDDFFFFNLAADVYITTSATLLTPRNRRTLDKFTTTLKQEARPVGMQQFKFNTLISTYCGVVTVQQLALQEKQALEKHLDVVTAGINLFQLVRQPLAPIVKSLHLAEEKHDPKIGDHREALQKLVVGGLQNLLSPPASADLAYITKTTDMFAKVKMSLPDNWIGELEIAAKELQNQVAAQVSANEKQENEFKASMDLWNCAMEMTRYCDKALLAKNTKDNAAPTKWYTSAPFLAPKLHADALTLKRLCDGFVYRAFVRLRTEVDRCKANADLTAVNHVLHNHVLQQWQANHVSISKYISCLQSCMNNVKRDLYKNHVPFQQRPVYCDPESAYTSTVFSPEKHLQNDLGQLIVDAVSDGLHVWDVESREVWVKSRYSAAQKAGELVTIYFRNRECRCANPDAECHVVSHLAKSNMLFEDGIAAAVAKLAQQARSFEQYFVQVLNDRNIDQLLVVMNHLKCVSSFTTQVTEWAASAKESRDRDSLQNILTYDMALTKLKTHIRQWAGTVLHGKSLLGEPRLQTAAAEDRDDFFNDVYKQYEPIQRLEALGEHAQIAFADISGAADLCIQELEEGIVQITRHLTTQMSTFPVGDANSKAYSEFSNYFDALRSVKHNFKHPAIENAASNGTKRVRTGFRELVARLTKEIHAGKSDRERADLLVTLKMIGLSAPSFSKIVDETGIDKMVLDRLLAERNGVHTVMNIGEILKTHQRLPDVALQLINNHVAFKSLQTYMRNEATLKFGFDDVKTNIRGDELDISQLETYFRKFDERYWDLVESGLSEANLKWYITHLAADCVKGVGVTGGKLPSPESSSAGVLGAVDVMAHLCAYWTLHVASQSSSHSKLSRADAEARKYLWQPHCCQIVAIFRLLGFDAKKPRSDANHLVEILTGEGKSVTLAVAAAVLALHGFAVDCVCYSSYLTDRDHNAFLVLFDAFKVCDRIKYGTFTSLCEDLINSSGNVRNLVESQISGAVQASTTPDLPSEAGRHPRALLIDEVDVFFSEDFYGSSYNPLASLGGEHVSRLIQYVWDARRNPGLSLKMVQESDPFQRCCAAFPRWESLIDEYVMQMLDSLRVFDQHEYIVHGGKIAYKEQDGISTKIHAGFLSSFAACQEADKITPSERERRLIFSVQCGQFSFAEAPKQYNVILGVTGTLKALGSSQIQMLREEYRISKQTYMPSVYGANQRVFYGDFDSASGAKSMVTVTNSMKEYYIAIKNEIEKPPGTKGDAKRRAVFVFFIDAPELQAFRLSREFSDLQSFAKVITEETSSDDKTGTIKQAATPGNVVLMTREFGRGTDFISYSDQLDDAGGVHVIQTFLSDCKSEEVQIQGRTARQGKFGSYSLILLAGGHARDAEVTGAAGKDGTDKSTNDASMHSESPSLEPFGITSGIIDEMRRTGRLYTTLDKKRETLFSKKHRAMMEKVVEIRENNAKAIDFVKNLHTPAADDAIRTFLVEQNTQERVACSSGRSRTLVLMDATGSMSSLLENAKQKVSTMFSRAKEVLAEVEARGQRVGSFELRFAVYRNYGDTAANLLVASDWESKPDNLKTFMGKSEACASGGYGADEAVEVGLQFANRLSDDPTDPLSVTQVIVIGDAPPNAEQAVDSKRQHRGEDYWSQNCGSVPGISNYWFNRTSTSKEIAKLREKGLKVHAFYLNDYTRPAFEKMAEDTGGTSNFLDVGAQGADELTHLVTEQVLSQSGGESAVVVYRQKWRGHLA